MSDQPTATAIWQEPQWPMPPPSYTLQFAPIEHGGTTYREIVLREPTWGEVQKVSDIRPMQEQTTRLIEIISGMPAEAVRQLPLSVMARAAAYIGGFTPPNSGLI